MTDQKKSIERIIGRKFSSPPVSSSCGRERSPLKASSMPFGARRNSICLQFYIFRNDETGTTLSDLLKEKSREGVKVYLLHDHFGSIGTPGSFWRDMTREGVQIRASHPFKWTAPFHYVHRDHRKLLVIDSRKAFTGGLNIADEYSGFHLRRRSRGWRDTGVFLEGPIVKELFETFQRSWYTWGGEKIAFQESGRNLRPAWSRIISPLSDVTASEWCGNLPALPIFVYSRKGRRRMRDLLRYSTDQARTTIFLTTAYFTPSRRMIVLLENAVRRGVRVRLLVPEKVIFLQRPMREEPFLQDS